MESWKLPESCGPAATKAQQQPPCSGSTENQDTSASSQAPSARRKVSSISRTSLCSRSSTSSTSSTSSRSTKSSQKSTSRKTYKKAAGEERECDEGRCQHYRSAPSWCMVLMAKTYPPRHVVCRKNVPKADKASQILQKEWQPSGKKKKRKKKNNSMSNGQDQPQRRTSRVSSATESCSQALPHRAPSPPTVSVTLQKRTSLFSLCMATYDEEGEKQGEAGPEPEGKQVNVGEMEFHLPPVEIHLPEQNYQEVLEDVAVDGDVVNNLDPDFNVGTTEVPLPSKELQETLGHTRVTEDTASVDSLCSYLATLETCLIPELQEDPTVDGYKEDTQNLDSIPGSAAREVNFTSKENLEALRDMEEDKVDVSSEGSTLATPRIHSNLEELKKAKVNERIARSPGCASKTSVTPKPLPKKVIKPLPMETTRDPSQILLPGIECKAAKSLTRKQGKAPGTNNSCNCDLIHARGILFFKLFLKLVELAALPQRILFQIISYYQQQLSDCAGQGAWVGSDFLGCHKKKPHKPQREIVYSLPSFISVPAFPVSAMNKRKAVGYVEHLRGSPYAQVPIFPLVYKQDAMTLAKRKKGSQKVARQRNEPTASFRSHTSHEESQVQEALEPPAHHTKQSCSPANTTERPDTPHSPATASSALPASPGKTQAQKAQAAKPYKHSPALSQRLSLLELWQKIIRTQIGLQMGDERFHRTFCTYSWSWNACRELVTVADLRRLERQLRRRRRRQMAAGTRQEPCRDGTDS